MAVRTYISGPYNFEPLGSGGFKIITPGKQVTYFAYVDVNGQTAEGSWNEERGANLAHTPVGTLKRNDACWSNQNAKVCAWR